MIGHGVPGLDIHQSYAFPNAAEQVFAALTQGFDAWWPLDWRQTGPGGHLALASEIGAALTETGPEGAAAIWGWVDAFELNKHLHLQGHFGIDGAVAGRVEFDLTETADGCTLSLLHQVIGPVPEDRGSKFKVAWRAAIDTNLRNYLLTQPS